jgi:hypothetical protein
MVNKYVKNPLEIEAVQWTGTNYRVMYDFLTETTNQNIEATGEHFYIDHSKGQGGLIIKTLEGEHIASIGDYIVKGIKGEFYPCKSDIFEKSYTQVTN